MNNWKEPIGGSGRNGARRNFTGPNSTSEKVDYSRLPAASISDDEGEDWIQRQIKGHKVKRWFIYFASKFRPSLILLPVESTNFCASATWGYCFSPRSCSLLEIAKRTCRVIRDV